MGKHGRFDARLLAMELRTGTDIWTLQCRSTCGQCVTPCCACTAMPSPTAHHVCVHSSLLILCMAECELHNSVGMYHRSWWPCSVCTVPC